MRDSQQPTIVSSELFSVRVPSEPELKNPALREVAGQLRCLDGSTFDQLYIEGRLSGGGAFWACVADGTGGDVVLSISSGGDTFNVVGDEPSDSEPAYALISSGGQETDTLTRWVVSIHVAGRGLWFFLATGELDPGLRWDAQSTVDFSPPLDHYRVRLPRDR